METLDEQLLRHVSGAGLFSPIGQALVTSVIVANQAQNHEAARVFGRAADALGPVGQGAHVATDQGLYHFVYKPTADLGYALGGKGDIPWHIDRPG